MTSPKTIKIHQVQLSELADSPAALNTVFDPEAFRDLALSGYALPDDLPWEELDDNTQEN